MKIYEAIEKYTKYVAVTRAKGTLTYLKGKTGIINKYLGELDCVDINQDTILQFIIDQKDRNMDISNRTINKYIFTIKQFLKYSCNIDFDFDKLPENKKMIEKNT